MAVSSVRCSRFKAGDTMNVVITATKVMQPPKITEGTVPIYLADTPLSKEPNSFDEPTNIACERVQK